ncbi:MAG: class I SAM-dependent methyltransferase [Aquincola sp.]|nr:class I SAM-dependent methyltransferase [Aquincola sp.]
MISDDYRDLITLKHDVRPWGGTGKSWVPMLTELFAKIGPIETVLDYGCGRGTLKPALEAAVEGVKVTEYDPGVRDKNTIPFAAYDYVVCTDVLEHVEEDKIDNVLVHIETLAVDGVFFVIVFTPCNSSLPDGRNTHILQRPRTWWDKKIAQHFGKNWGWIYHEEGSGRVVMSGLRV